MTEEDAQFTALCDKAEKAALRLIGRAEQNSLGLTAKLKKRGFDAAVVKETVQRLLDRNLLNDERYAELWLRSYLSSGKKTTPLHLRSSLAKRGIDRNSAEKAIKRTLDPETEYSLLLRYLGTGKGEINKPKLKKEGFSNEVLLNYSLQATDQ